MDGWQGRFQTAAAACAVGDVQEYIPHRGRKESVMKFKVFISSVQDEFAAERRKLKDWLGSDPFISRFVESVFLFEDVPAKGRSPAVSIRAEIESRQNRANRAKRRTTDKTPGKQGKSDPQAKGVTTNYPTNYTANHYGRFAE